MAIESADAEIEDEPEIIDADIEINAYEIEDLTRVEQESQSAEYTDAIMKSHRGPALARCELVGKAGKSRGTQHASRKSLEGRRARIS